MGIPRWDYTLKSLHHGESKNSIESKTALSAINNSRQKKNPSNYATLKLNARQPLSLKGRISTPLQAYIFAPNISLLILPSNY